jgi:hypothetical protein
MTGLHWVLRPLSKDETVLGKMKGEERKASEEAMEEE